MYQTTATIIAEAITKQISNGQERESLGRD